MPRRATRRELLIAGATGAAALAANAAPALQEADTAKVESQLAKPLEESAKKLLAGAVRNVNNNHKERLKFKLPEGSEPCTVYPPSGVVVRK